MAAQILCAVLLALAPFVAADEYPQITYKNSWKCRKAKPDWDAGERVQSTGWNEKIITFPNEVKVQRDPASGPGCYKISARVLLRDEIKEPFQARIWVRIGGTKSEPLPCSRTHEEELTCTKGWGSCIYCNLCSEISKVRVEVDGVNQTVRCPLKKNWHTLTHSLCLPKTSEFQRLIPEDIKRILQITSDKGSDTDMHVRVEIFDTDIAKKCAAYYKPTECPHNREVERAMVGCLQIYGTITAAIDQAPIPPKRRSHLQQPTRHN